MARAEDDGARGGFFANGRRATDGEVGGVAAPPTSPGTRSAIAGELCSGDVVMRRVKELERLEPATSADARRGGRDTAVLAPSISSIVDRR